MTAETIKALDDARMYANQLRSALERANNSGEIDVVRGPVWGDVAGEVGMALEAAQALVGRVRRAHALAIYSSEHETESPGPVAR